jgi:hypothetical protein
MLDKFATLFRRTDKEASKTFYSKTPSKQGDLSIFATLFKRTDKETQSSR